MVPERVPCMQNNTIVGITTVTKIHTLPGGIHEKNTVEDEKKSIG